MRIGIISRIENLNMQHIMKHWIATFVLTVAFASSVWAGVEILSLSVYALGDHARLEWRTGQELSFEKFVVERSPDGVNYLPVGQIDASGSFSEYAFTDDSPLDVERELTFFYRLKLLNNDGTYGFSEAIEVSLNFSAVRQTWGSIKAMFR